MANMLRGLNAKIIAADADSTSTGEYRRRNLAADIDGLDEVSISPSSCEKKDQTVG